MLFIGKKRVFGTGVKRYRQLTVHRDVGMRMAARAPVIAPAIGATRGSRDRTHASANWAGVHSSAAASRHSRVLSEYSICTAVIGWIIPKQVPPEPPSR
jgi:hypothetical protein